MVTADVQIVGQGSVVVTPIREYHDENYDLIYYQVAATPAVGWAYQSFECMSHVHVVSAHGNDRDEYQGIFSTDNPVVDNFLADGTAVFPDLETWYYTIEDAVATFVPIHDRGIIYDPNQQNGIIYDLTTGLPMCYT